MNGFTTIRFWMVVTVAWLGLCILLFDRWFFFSPLGLILAFGLPLGGWFAWWRYAPAEGNEISPGEKQMLELGQEFLQDLKKRFNRQQ